MRSLKTTTWLCYLVLESLYILCKRILPSLISLILRLTGVLTKSLGNFKLLPQDYWCGNWQQLIGSRNLNREKKNISHITKARISAKNFSQFIYEKILK